MTDFTVPKFIEHKAKIVGPLTLPQALYLGGAAALCLFFYFILPFFLFIMASLITIAAGVSLALGKVGGVSLPQMVKNFLIFSVSPKIYLWERKTGLPPKFKKEKPKPHFKKEELKSVPAATGRSKLRDISTLLQTGGEK